MLMLWYRNNFDIKVVFTSIIVFYKYTGFSFSFYSLRDFKLAVTLTFILPDFLSKHTFINLILQSTYACVQKKYTVMHTQQ